MKPFFTSLQWLSLIILFGELTYVSMKRASKLQTTLILLIVSTFIMMGGYLLEIEAVTEGAAMYGTIVSYVGKPMTMLFSLLFILCYCGYELPGWVKVPLVLFNAFFAAAVATNSYHHLFYSSIAFDRSREFSPLILGHGPIYNIYMCVIFLNLIIDIALVAREYRKTDYHTSYGRTYLIQLTFILAMITVGILGYIVFMTGITQGYDTTMLGCFIGTLILGLLFMRYRIFDVLTLAKEAALQHAENGLLVIDSRDKIVYINDTARTLLDHGVTRDQLVSVKDKTSLLENSGHYYTVSSFDIIQDGRVYGRSVEINDVTDSHMYSTRLEQDVEERTRQIRHMQRSIIGSFANIVEARDDTTGYHIKRTSQYVGILAETMRSKLGFDDVIDEEYVTRLEDAAPMHDIGKISVPDRVLNKPGKLTPEEFEIIKTHTTRGAEIIESSMRGIETDRFTTLAKEVALYHHEKWDGSGYPQGLKGRDIPIAARIMALADVYDALRSERPYKKAFSEEEAARIILESSGTHFDPDVVKAFELNRQKFEAISDKLAD